MKKALVAASGFGFINAFEKSDIKLLQTLGYKVYCVCKLDYNKRGDQIKELESQGVIINNFNFCRKPFNLNNLKEYKRLKKLINTERFSIIHCHTPVVGFLTRLAARKERRKGTKIIYTAHGFHFYKRAPLLNWIMYYPIEKISSYFTDEIITINTEDYERAKRKFKKPKIHYIPGVGIDVAKLSTKTIAKDKKKEQLDLPAESIVLLSVGELNNNKNHQIIIRALEQLKDKRIYYLIAGSGKNKEKLEKLTQKHNLQDRVKLLGYRRDISELCQVADIFCFPSYREGLSVALMEAMSNGLPCVVSKIRGNIDLIENKKQGYHCRPGSVSDFANALTELSHNNRLKEELGAASAKKIKEFDIAIAKKSMEEIYRKQL